MITLSLPVAPTANNAFLNRKSGRGFGRIKSSKYRTWLKQADFWHIVNRFAGERVADGPYTVKLMFPKLRGDLDGRAKLVIDWLVSRELTPDDRYLRGVELTMGDKPGDILHIVVQEHGRAEHDATQASPQGERG